MNTEERREKIKESICSFLREGMYKRDAARLAGVSEDTYLRWYEEDAGFADKVEANILEFKRSLIKIVNEHAVKDGRLALEVLRRRWSEDWNEHKEKPRIGKVKVEIVYSKDELDEVGKQIALVS